MKKKKKKRNWAFDSCGFFSEGIFSGDICKTSKQHFKHRFEWKNETERWTEQRRKKDLQMLQALTSSSSSSKISACALCLYELLVWVFIKMWIWKLCTPVQMHGLLMRHTQSSATFGLRAHSFGHTPPSIVEERKSSSYSSKHFGTISLNKMCVCVCRMPTNMFNTQSPFTHPCSARFAVNFGEDRG